MEQSKIGPAPLPSPIMNPNEFLYDLFSQASLDTSTVDLRKKIQESKVRIPDLWNYCQTALTDPRSSEEILSRVTAILLLFEMEGSWEEILINVLTGPVLQKLAKRPSDSICAQAVLGLVYDLCCIQNQEGIRNLEAEAALHWLQGFIERQVQSEKVEVKALEVGYMRALSAALWSVASTPEGNGSDLTEIITSELFKTLFQLSIKVQSEGNSRLKAVVDYMISSMCYCRPWLFVYLMYLMNLLKVKSGSVLDERIMINLLRKWYNEGSIWTKLEPKSLQSSSGDLDLTYLETLGRATQSPTTAKILKESSLLEYFKGAISEFCKAKASGVTGGSIMTPEQLVKILRFALTLTFVKDLRGWIGVTQDLWLSLLTLLSSSHFGAEKLEEMESVMIAVLKIVCQSHTNPENLTSLKQVISREKELSSFCRRLLVELLLREEKVFVFVKTKREGKISLKMPSLNLPREFEDLHPSIGVKGMGRLLLLDNGTKAQDILEMIEGCKDFNLRLASCPNVDVPLHLPLKTLFTVKGQTPFFNVLDILLSQEQAQSDQDLFNVDPVQSTLKTFCLDGGLKLILERVDQTQVEVETNISPDIIIIAALLRFLNLPQYLEVLFEKKFHYQTNCLIRLSLGVTIDSDGKPILRKMLETLPFDALSWLLETHTLSKEEEGRNLRRKMMDDGIIHFILDNLDRANKVPVPALKDEDWEDEEKLEAKDEKLICCLNVLINFIKSAKEDDDDEFLTGVNMLLKKSSLMSVVSEYLRNDSVHVIAAHFPLFKVILQLLRSIASIPQLGSLLVSGEGGCSVISGLLVKMKNVAIQYYHLLKASNAHDLVFTPLVPDIRGTVNQVERAVMEFQKRQDQKKSSEDIGVSPIAPVKAIEDRYVEEMQKLQFAFMEMIATGQVFKVPYHFQHEVWKDWEGNSQKRGKRLCQEILSLSTSLPLSYGSSIFLRCDENRLDVIKVLITGPAGTPYSNGCFEFDIFLPFDYPDSPPKVNFITPGPGIRFSPDLYEGGKVCLSYLNKWNENSEEKKWNTETCSLLSVLLDIQSSILVDEPHRKSGTENEEGKEKSRDYNSQICYYTLQYAILGKIQNPTDCFREVIHRHFWMKKEEILAQCEEWNETSSKKADIYSRDYFMKQTTSVLKSELLKMTPPEGLEDLQIVKPEETVPPPVKKSSLENLSLDELMKKLQPSHSVTEPMYMEKNNDSVSKGLDDLKTKPNTKTTASLSSPFKSEALKKKAWEVKDSRPTTPVTPLKKKCKGLKKGDKGECDLQ